MQNIMEKQTAKVHSMEQVPFLLVKNDKLKYLNDMANTFSNFLITITEKLNTQYQQIYLL
jgi:hypothetical protein